MDLKRDIKNKRGKVLTFDLPVTPSVNHIYYNTKGGGKRLTSKAENYIKMARAKARMVIEDEEWTLPSEHTWVYLDLYFFFPDRRTRDSHNCLKLLLDSLEGLCFTNDYFVMPRINLVEYDKENPRIVLRFSQQIESDRSKALSLIEK